MSRRRCCCCDPAKICQQLKDTYQLTISGTNGALMSIATLSTSNYQPGYFPGSWTEQCDIDATYVLTRVSDCGWITVNTSIYGGNWVDGPWHYANITAYSSSSPVANPPGPPCDYVGVGTVVWPPPNEVPVQSVMGVQASLGLSVDCSKKQGQWSLTVMTQGPPQTGDILNMYFFYTGDPFSLDGGIPSPSFPHPPKTEATTGFGEYDGYVPCSYPIPTVLVS